MGCIASCCGRIFCCYKGDDADAEIDELIKAKKFGFVEKSDRKCRDIACCIIICIVWLGMIIIGAIALAEGDPNRLIRGLDYEGHVCGVDDEVKDRGLIAYPRVNEDYLANLGRDISDFKFYGVCISKCPTQGQVVCNENVATVENTGPTGNSQTVLDNCLAGTTTAGTAITPATQTCQDVLENCWYTPVDAKNILFRCIPVYTTTNGQGATCILPDKTPPLSADDADCVTIRENRTSVVVRPAKPNFLFEQLNSAAQVWSRYMSDLFSAWWVIVLCSIGGGVLFGMLWLVLLRFCTKCIVWTSLLLALLVCVAFTTFLYYKADLINTEDGRLASFAERLSVELPTGSTATTPGDDTEANNQTAFKVLAYIMTGVTIIVLIGLIVLRKSIAMGIDVIKMGSGGMAARPQLLIAPILGALAVFAYACWWIFTMAALFSVQDISTVDLSSRMEEGLSSVNNAIPVTDLRNATNIFKAAEDKPVFKYLAAYQVFAGLVSVNYILGIGIMAVAGVISQWYFNHGRRDAKKGSSKKDGGAAEAKGSGAAAATSGDGEAKDADDAPSRSEPIMQDGIKFAGMSRFPLFASYWRVLRFAMGTVAFYAIMVAIVQFLRLLLEYVDRRTQEFQKRVGGGCFFKVIMTCLRCALWCLEKVVKFIGKNGLIIASLKGTSFCASARHAIMLILKHLKVLAVVNIIGQIIIWMCVVTVSIACGFLAFLALDNLDQFQAGGDDELSSSWLSVLVTVLFAYVVASVFFNVWDLAVDTTLMATLIDMQENVLIHGGDEKFRFAAHTLGKSDVLRELAAKKQAREERDALGSTKKASSAKATTVNPAASTAHK